MLTFLRNLQISSEIFTISKKFRKFPILWNYHHVIQIYYNHYSPIQHYLNIVQYYTTIIIFMFKMTNYMIWTLSIKRILLYTWFKFFRDSFNNKKHNICLLAIFNDDFWINDWGSRTSNLFTKFSGFISGVAMLLFLCGYFVNLKIRYVAKRTRIFVNGTLLDIFFTFCFGMFHKTLTQKPKLFFYGNSTGILFF